MVKRRYPQEEPSKPRGERQNSSGKSVRHRNAALAGARLRLQPIRYQSSKGSESPK